MLLEDEMTESRTMRRLADLGPSLRRARSVLAHSCTRAGSSGWLQVNIALFLQRPGMPPFTPWVHLLAALEEWRAGGRFTGCFFVRKEPGLRLRFWGEHLTERLEPELLVWLRAAEQRDQIRSFRVVVYEPEEHLFGGPLGMALAHRQFDHDARLALRYEALPPADRAGLAPHLLSLALLSDLFNRTADDLGEIWDVWQRLRQARDVLPLPTAATEAQLRQVHAIMDHAPSFLSALPLPIQELLCDGRAANDQIATALRAASSGGRMTIGPRAWLMAVSIFQWNRLGLDADEQIQLIAWMLQLLNPHGQSA